MNANLSVVGNIGDKLKLPINYNTMANFDFENQIKLDYTGTSDEIIKRIELGNTSFATKGTLIPGAQQLFGIKTQLQFGKLYFTGVIANQRSSRQSLGLQGGSTNTYFEFKANDYEENRHFLLSQYFRQNFNRAMRDLPKVNSQVQILRLEVWVTNRNGSFTDTRDIVALMDLGEPDPFNPLITPLTNQPFAFNDANDLYRRIINNPASRNSSQITSVLNSLGLKLSGCNSGYHTNQPGRSAKSIILEIAESNFTKNKSSTLGPDDEKRLFFTFKGWKLPEQLYF
jgi:cell surface protein SprA